MEKQIVYKSNPLSTLMIALLIGAAFIIGLLYSKVQVLEQMSTGKLAVNNGNQPAANAGTGANNPPAAAAPAAAQQAPTPGDFPPVSEADHIQGSADAEVILIEYSDTDCPFCQQFHPTVQRVVDEYAGKVAWVYRHFPLPIHPGADTEANATECVAQLGGEEAFWKYLDSVLQQNYDEAGLVTLAANQGINQASMQSCVTGNTHATKIQTQAQEAQRAGINGTPGSILVAKDGQAKIVSGALPYEQLKAQIESALQ